MKFLLKRVVLFLVQYKKHQDFEECHRFRKKARTFHQKLFLHLTVFAGCFCLNSSIGILNRHTGTKFLGVLAVIFSLRRIYPPPPPPSICISANANISDSYALNKTPFSTLILGLHLTFFHRAVKLSAPAQLVPLLPEFFLFLNFS